jgi:hypothetical protein
MGELTNLVNSHDGDVAAPINIDAAELAIGVATEMEHTNDLKVAKTIALDHLQEHPDYYTRLAKAGLSRDHDSLANSGYGDPDAGFNDSSRVGSGQLINTNMGGKIGTTPSGEVSGRRSVPVHNKTLDIELESKQSTSNLIRKETNMKLTHLQQKIRELVKAELLESNNTVPLKEDGPIPNSDLEATADEETVTLTLKRALAQNLHDVLMTVLAPDEEEGEGGGEGDEGDVPLPGVTPAAGSDAPVEPEGGDAPAAAPEPAADEPAQAPAQAPAPEGGDDEDDEDDVTAVNESKLISAAKKLTSTYNKRRGDKTRKIQNNIKKVVANQKG